MKAQLSFDLNEPYEEQGLQDAINGSKYKHTLDSMWFLLFRPNNKHGYNNKVLDSDAAYEVIEELSKIYLEVVEGTHEI